jgi:hypothetical protein
MTHHPDLRCLVKPIREKDEIVPQPCGRGNDHRFDRPLRLGIDRDPLTSDGFREALPDLEVGIITELFDRHAESLQIGAIDNGVETQLKSGQSIVIEAGQPTIEPPRKEQRSPVVSRIPIATVKSPGTT